MNTNRIKSIIDKMPICNDGKTSIYQLIEEITGIELANKVLKTGQVYAKNGWYGVLIGLSGGYTLASLTSSGNTYCDVRPTMEDAIGDTKFVSNSVDDFYKGVYRK